MKRYRLVVAPIVHEQIREQVLFIAQHSIENALAWEDRLEQAIKGLTSVTGDAIDEEASDRLGFTLHRLVFGSSYLIHYTIDEPAGVVRVVNFRHGKGKSCPAALPQLK